MRHVILSLVTFLSVSCSAAADKTAANSAAEGEPVTVLMGGEIRTMNPKQPIAEALAFDSAGKIVAVGSMGDVRKAAGDNARFVELGGAIAVPGFQDVHQHPLEAGLSENRCILSEIADHDTYEAEILDCADAQMSRPWFYAAGVSMPDLLDLEARPVDFLDELIPDKPALIMDNIGHGAWANSLALKAVGYDDMLADPQGGLIDYDVDGNPSGVVFENAQQALRDAALPPTAENLEENYQGLLKALPILAENGITTVSDAGGYWTRGHHKAWVRAEAEGALTVRANNALYIYPDRPMEQQIEDVMALQSNDPDALVRFGQVKIYVDGILSQGTAALYRPYTSDPGVGDVSARGFEYFTKDELQTYAAEFQSAGFGLHFHATGDRGVGLALDTISAAEAANGKTEARHRVTHLFMVDPKDRTRFESLGVFADVQLSPSALTDEYKAYLKTILGTRAEGLMPAASLLKAGAPMTLSSDWDADELSPFIKIEAALMRNDEALPDIQTAMRLMTLEPAKLLGHANKTGSLEVGKYADIAILDQNIFTVATAKIGDTQVVATLLGGEPIYDADKMFVGVVK